MTNSKKTNPIYLNQQRSNRTVELPKNKSFLQNADLNLRPDYDGEIKKIARYVSQEVISSNDAYHTARLCLIDALGCGILALNHTECTKLLGPVVPGTIVPNGIPIPGTTYILDPILAAFNIGAMIRWLDYNDTWLGQEWGHPSDNLGAILAVADHLSRNRISENKSPLLMRDVLTSMIKAYEIQGILALENSLNRVGLDHVALVKIASTAIVTHLLGGDENDIISALSQAFVDGQSLRTYRHAPNTCSRKSWAAGDATSRAVQLAFFTLKGEKGLPSILSAKTWGFYDVFFNGQPLNIDRPYGSYIIENILFKISFPAEYHAQTALEAAIKLHIKVKDRLEDIESIKLTTQESAIRIISKLGPLYNPADRDHCLQYIVAIALIFGDLTAEHYEDAIAKDHRIDLLRSKMEVLEDPKFSKDYHDPRKRSIGNAIQIYFKDGSKTEKVLIEYPLGHRKRRQEGLPYLVKKFKNNLSSHYSQQQSEAIFNMCQDQATFEAFPVNVFMDALIKN